MEKMKKILEKEEFKPLKVNEIVKGKVIGKGHLVLYVDLGHRGTGIIYGSEYILAKDKIKNLKISDQISARVIDVDNPEGFVELSLRGMEIEEKFEQLRELQEKGEVFRVKVLKVNRGGLITKLFGLPAFLPISKLKEKTEKLNEFLGKELEVVISDLSPEGEIILAQKIAQEELKEGEIIEGEISGLTSYGAFFKFNQREGLIPISEIPENFNLKIGEKVRAKLILVENQKLIFSLRL